MTGKVEAKYPSLKPGKLQTCTDTLTNRLDKTLDLIEIRQQLFNLDTNTEINNQIISLQELESGVSQVGWAASFCCPPAPELIKKT